MVLQHKLKRIHFFFYVGAADTGLVILFGDLDGFLDDFGYGAASLGQQNAYGSESYLITLFYVLSLVLLFFAVI